MKSIIKLVVLIYLHKNSYSLGINIYYKDNLDKGLDVYNEIINQGIPEELVSLIKKQRPCDPTHEESFIDLCIRDNELEILRNTEWLQQSLEPLIDSRQRLITQ